MQRSKFITLPFGLFLPFYIAKLHGPNQRIPTVRIHERLFKAFWISFSPSTLMSPKRDMHRELVGRRESEVAELRARQILDILDARGAFVVLEDLSTDPNFVDSEGKAEVAMSPKLPSILVEKRNNRWIVSRETQCASPSCMSIDGRRPTSLRSKIFPPGCKVAVWDSRRGRFSVFSG